MHADRAWGRRRRHRRGPVRFRTRSGLGLVADGYRQPRPAARLARRAAATGSARHAVRPGRAVGPVAAARRDSAEEHEVEDAGGPGRQSPLVRATRRSRALRWQELLRRQGTKDRIAIARTPLFVYL